MTRAVLVALLGATAMACDDDTGPGGQEGLTRILLTDAPFPYDQVQHVNVHIVSISATRNFDTTQAVEWTTLAQPDRTIDLLELQDGATTVLGEADVSAFDYEAVRMVINTARSAIILTDGSAATVNWQGPAEQTIHARMFQSLASWAPGTTSDLVIDFDVGRSFQMTAPGQFVFVPWIRAVSEIETGTIRGVVRGANLPSEVLQPVPGASISLYQGASTLTLAATARADAQGRFAIHYLSAGGPYLLQATPPAGFDSPDGYTGNVQVVMGEETNADVLLGTDPPDLMDGLRLVISGPSQVTVGQTIWLYAFVFSENGDSVLGPPVTWSQDSPAVASLSGGAGSVVQLTGLGPGSTTVIAQSGELADTATITVGDPNAAIASIEVVPANLTISVGDSAGFQAVVRDAVGNVLNDQSVTWSLDSSSVITVIGQFGQHLLIRGTSPGSRVIRASAGAKEGSGTVVVN